MSITVDASTSGLGDSFETKLRADILLYARDHDRMVQGALARVWDAVGLRADRSSGEATRSAAQILRAEEAVSELLAATATFDALFAPAAIAKALELAPFVDRRTAHGTSAISNFDGAEADDFFRPLFDAAGMGERFVLSMVSADRPDFGWPYPHAQ